MTTPQLTVAVIVLNEGPHLRELLPRLCFADEVLVVDGGSNDDTIAVAQGNGAKVVVRRFDHFAAQRNAAMSAASGDWILFIDADERPTPGLPDELRRRMRSTCCGYQVPIRSTIFGRRFRFSGTQHDAPLRFVRRDAGSWGGAVHETFAARGAVGRFDSHLEHYTLPNVRTFLAKMRRYTTIAARERVASGRRPSVSGLFARPPLEVFRRLVWKHGWLDGPEGWLFCGLSGMSEWMLEREHRRLWNLQQSTSAQASTTTDLSSDWCSTIEGVAG